MYSGGKSAVSLVNYNSKATVSLVHFDSRISATRGGNHTFTPPSLKR